ncbi:MAG: DUF3391 domain-containing protein, partial [Sulfuricellaceae bacterium]|nr:DUF3391 domain-containing protein [Sulfuricellaceae bacterium]
MTRKLIKIKHLTPGMYIDELNCSLKERERIGETRNFLVISQNEIDRLASLGVQELYIDPEKGMDHIDEDEERKKSNQAIAELARLRNTHHAPKPKSLADELYDARLVLTKTRAELEKAIANLRAGKKIELAPIRPVLEEIYKSVSENKDAIVTVCRKKKKGGYALEHSVTHCALMMAFGQTMEMGQSALLDLGLGGLFLDIGMIRVPAAILDKQGALTAEELDVIRKHPSWGASFVKSTDGFPEKALAVVLEHHERLDGTGYPKQLKEHEISLFGQMASIVDVYDACISIRNYGSAADPCLVIRQLFEGAGKLFHKELVQQFIKTIGIYPVGTLARLE